MQRNCVFIPGWMDVVKNYGQYPGLEIWVKDIDPKEKIESQYVIGHSLGANFALLNWRENKNTKLILINPVVYPRSIVGWVFSWFSFFLFERPLPNSHRIRALIHLPSGIKKCLRFFKEDYSKIISEIPKADLIVFKGKNDKFLCDKKAEEFLKSQGVKVIEVEAGHDWNKNFEIAVNNIIT